MALTQGQTTSFKVEKLRAIHNFDTGGDVFKLALYADTATLGADTTAYTAAGEITGTGYTAGGNTLVNITPSASGTIGVTSFETTGWTGALTARGGLIYNSSKANRSVCVLDFGSNKTSLVSFVVQFPTPIGTAAIISEA